jgi:hypothetical protein
MTQVLFFLSLHSLYATLGRPPREHPRFIRAFFAPTMSGNVTLSTWFDDLRKQGHVVTQNTLHPDVPAPSFADDGVMPILLEGFRSEGRSTCVFILIGCATEIILAHKRNGNSAAIDALRTQALFFFSAPRTRARLTALVTRLQCVCSGTETRSALQNRLHGQGELNYQGRCVESGQRAPASVLFEVTTEAFGEFCISRNSSRDSWPCRMQRRLRRGAQGAAVPWPHSVHDLLPHGDQTALGLLSWLELGLDLNTGHRVLMLMDSLIHACPAETMPFLVRDPSLVRGIIAVTLQAEQAWLRSHLQTKQTTMQLLLCTAGLLGTLLDRSSSREQDILWRSSPTALLAASMRALRLLKLDGAPFWVGFSAEEATTRQGVNAHSQAVLSRVICCIRVVCPETSHIPLGPDVPAAVTGWMMNALSKRKQPWVQLITHLDLLHLRHRCGNPDCPAPIPFHGARWRYCTQCRRVPFCSSNCQRNAWRHSSCPHALACSHLRNLCSRLRIPRKIIASDHALAMNARLRPLGVEWTPLIDSIVRYFDSMSKYLENIGNT